MILKKKYLTLFYKTLAEAKTDVAKNHISLADARIRDALATKVVYDLLKDFEEARKKIFDEFCIKNKDGNPDLKDGNYQFEGENVKQMMEEVKVLEEEEVTFEIKDPAKIKTFLNNTKYEPQVGESIVIDEIIALIA